jgi:methanol--5-hydroxybenzimidazolylcobamide Co-methyltransferase
MSERRLAKSLAYESVDEAIFGFAKRPVTCGHGVNIGCGEVLPEVNFTLPPMPIRDETLSEVRQRFREMVTRILQRAVHLGQEALVLEFEQLYEMTRNPDWGAIITSDIKKVMDEFNQRHGLKAALRVTVADIRDEERPPKMRTGVPTAKMLQAFELCADAGADILSIESTGGKEVSDRALVEGDIEGLIFALGVLAPRDMEFLWGQIVDIANRHGIVAGGDTACGFANTAMQLAHQGLIPKVLAAVMRLVCAPRSLVAVEMGATGPLKDCGYENPIIKFIAGVPISMEGKSSACAHSSPLGNIAAAVCDLWSNESVQDVRLLGGFAPEVFTEILIYDCRLMNTALKNGQGKCLRDLFVESDRFRDPQALMLDLAVMHEAAKRIVVSSDDYHRTVAMAKLAVETIQDAVNDGKLSLPERELRWLAMISDAIQALPSSAEQLTERAMVVWGETFVPSEYGL